MSENIAKRLEELRTELRAERISYGELHELQSLADHIPAGDVELLEAAGVPEFPDEEATVSTIPGAPKGTPTVVYVVVEDLASGIDLEVSVHATLDSAFNGDDHLFHVRRDGAWAHEDGYLFIFEKVVSIPN